MKKRLAKTMCRFKKLSFCMYIICIYVWLIGINSLSLHIIKHQKSPKMKVQDFSEVIEKLKKENDDLVNFKVVFSVSKLHLVGDLYENGKFVNVYQAGDIADFFIPTEKGYYSAEWKNGKFFKMYHFEVTDELLNELEPFLQSKEPKIFVKKTGISVASAIAHHINDSGSMLEEYSRI